jgi:hypothetical protein
MAQILSVRPKDLVVEPMSDGVVVARRAKLRPFPNDDRPRYQVRALARHSSQPHVKGFEALDEYSTFDPECRSRAIMETSGWF